MTEEEKYKLLYDRYTKCRDLELDSFWKNSTFVWVFLAVCFAAFGKIVLDYIETTCEVKKETLVILLSIISYCGYFLSRIWTWMARGLKAWYEVYENALWELETTNNRFNFDRDYTIENYWNLKSDGLSFFNSDKISPSRIVILIGHLLSTIWLVASVKCLWIYWKCSFIWLGCPNCGFLLCLLLGLIICYLCYKWLFSTTLRNKEEDMIFHMVKTDLKHYNVAQSYFEVKKGEVSFWGNDIYKTLKHIYNIDPEYRDNTFKFKLDTMVEYYSYTNQLKKILSVNNNLCTKKMIRKDSNIFLYINKKLEEQVKIILQKQLSCEKEKDKISNIKYSQKKLVIPINLIQIPEVGKCTKIIQWSSKWLTLMGNAII